MSRVITIGQYVDEKDIIFFHLKPVSIAALRAFSAQFNDLRDLKEEDRAAKEMELNIDAIARWSVQAPTKKQKNIETGNDDQVPAYPEIESIVDAVKKRFAELDKVDAEWMAQSIIQAYQDGLIPKTAFI